jgi:hypothetical protein
MTDPEHQPLAREELYHDYSGNRIPWYVALLWLGFFAFAVWYLLEYLIPALQREMLAPP